MTLPLLLLSMAGTAALGGSAVAAMLRRSPPELAGRDALIAGSAYPVGALLVAAWMQLLAALGVPLSVLVAVAPAVAGMALVAWRLTRGDGGAWRRGLDRVLGRSLPRDERRIWLALVAWLALRFALLAMDAFSRPALPWEAWLQSAARGHLWHALRAPAAFVPEATWWNASAYLAALTGGSAFAAALDAWTTFAIGGFDDTSIHAPWLALLAAQALLAYAAMRSAGASPVAALLASTLVATLPLPNAHAALGGTGALVAATFYLGAFAAGSRAPIGPSKGEAALALTMVAGLVFAAGLAGAVWAITLLPFAASRLPVATMRKAFGGALVAASLVAMLVAQNRLFAPATLQDIPSAGLAALAQHALFLGNWHVLAYAALAAAVLGVHDWRTTALLPATATVALGLVAVVALSASAAGRSLLGSTGAIGQAGTVLAPVLALWTARVAHAWWARTRGDEAQAATPPTVADATASVPSPSGDAAS